jgi:Glycosyl transferase family 11
MPVYLNLKGGLGNQLFQIATLISYSMDHGVPFQLPLNMSSNNPRHTYWDTILKSLREYLQDQYLKNTPKYQEPIFSYSEIPAGLNNVVLDGYFQSYKYFYKNRDTILDIMGLKCERESVLGIYQDLTRFSPGPTISLHFRRGDYKEKPENHPMLTVEYYKNALNHILETQPNLGSVPYTILYFCEEGDQEVVNNMMDLLLTNFPKNQFVKKQVPFEIPDWKQMLIMSHCDINIIANSTFSWWGAFLGNPSLVIYPDKWFGQGYGHYDTSDICPPSWVKIKDGSLPPKRTSYLLTVDPNSNRATTVKTTLSNIRGFQVQTVTAIPAKDTSEESRRISNRDSILSILRTIANQDCDMFHYIFEDDVALIEPVTLHEITLYEIISKEQGIFYLGACLYNQVTLEPTPYDIYDHLVYKVKENIRGAHAFAVTPRCAKQILMFYESHFIDEIASDVILENYVNQFTNGIHVVRPDLISPFMDTHRGIFYQDRVNHSSIIEENKKVLDENKIE